MTPPTPLSLLKKLCQPAQRRDWQQAWMDFVELYTPVLLVWARRVAQNQTEADDVVQEVFTKLASNMSAYDSKQGRFRNWLRVVTVNAWRELKRKDPRAASPLLVDAVPDSAEQFWEGEHRAYLARRALQLMQKDFPDTWEACWEILVLAHPLVEVAKKHGKTESALRMAKCRILRRLKDELDGLE